MRPGYRAIGIFCEDKKRIGCIRPGTACIQVVCASFGTRSEVGTQRVEGGLLYDFL